jgi:3-aminobutyryl-CoA ammonia-lyase
MASTGSTDGHVGLTVTHRRYVPYSHAHYAGNLVDGAYSLGLFGDVATELCIRSDGDEGLFASYAEVQFRAPVRAGDVLEVTAELVRVGRRSREIRFTASRRRPRHARRLGVGGLDAGRAGGGDDRHRHRRRPLTAGVWTSPACRARHAGLNRFSSSAVRLPHMLLTCGFAAFVQVTCRLTGVWGPMAECGFVPPGRTTWLGVGPGVGARVECHVAMHPSTGRSCQRVGRTRGENVASRQRTCIAAPSDDKYGPKVHAAPPDPAWQRLRAG